MARYIDPFWLVGVAAGVFLNSVRVTAAACGPDADALAAPFFYSVVCSVVCSVACFCLSRLDEPRPDYQSALDMILAEQGADYVTLILQQELARILRHNDEYHARHKKHPLPDESSAFSSDASSESGSESKAHSDASGRSDESESEDESEDESKAFASSDESEGESESKACADTGSDNGIEVVDAAKTIDALRLADGAEADLPD